MLNIPEYKEYAGETKIALMDNSSLAFMHELSQRSYPSDGILSVYDMILIPKWVMEEIEDSTYRSTYVEQLQAQGYPIRWIDETKYGAFVNQEMGWDSECRYKMLGYRITFEGETLYVFDLLVPEIFHEGQRRKKNAADSQDNVAATKPVDSRKGFYPDDIVGTFGVPVEEHRKGSEVQQMDGYVSMGILTGKIVPEAGKD